MKIKYKKTFYIWLSLHVFMWLNVLAWETDYHHLENNTFAKIGLIGLNLPISIAVNYPINKFELLKNKPEPGLNPWSRPEESEMKYIKIKWSLAILIFMVTGFMQWVVMGAVFRKIKSVCIAHEKL